MAAPILTLGTSLSSPVVGNPYGTVYSMCDLADETGAVLVAHGKGYAGTLPTTTGVFQKGCTFTETDTGSYWINISAVTSAASWHNIY